MKLNVILKEQDDSSLKLNLNLITNNFNTFYSYLKIDMLQLFTFITFLNPKKTTTL